jgi:hypothetical protein
MIRNSTRRAYIKAGLVFGASVSGVRVVRGTEEEGLSVEDLMLEPGALKRVLLIHAELIRSEARADFSIWLGLVFSAHYWGGKVVIRCGFCATE